MWNPALIDGPVVVPVYGDDALEDDTGAAYLPVTGYRPGYHLNVAPELITPDLAAFEVDPATPARVFAGGATGFLEFADEAEARAHLGTYWFDPS